MVFGWVKSSWAAVRKALTKTRNALASKINALMGRKVDEGLLEELEEILFDADLGVLVIQDILKDIRQYIKEHPEATVDSLLSCLEGSLSKEMSQLNFQLAENPNGPTVILVIGANGSGKTTSIAKLAHGFLSQKKTVLLAAADTFRAAAQEQLGVWGNRLQLDVIHGASMADPAAVAFDAISAAKARGIDILIVDTAGRLENKQHLLRELEKVKKTCHKALPGAPHEILLVLDATIGQNGVEQARSFHNSIGITGLVLTKLDGSAKGGVVISIQKQLGLPVKFIGVGETVDAFIPFNPQSFVHSMLFEEAGSAEDLQT
jgi:fused signal recognition particle receptor